MALQPCDECGQQISDKAASCPHCGAPVEPRVWCTNCGAEVPAGLSFCPKCRKPSSGRESAIGSGLPRPSGRAESANSVARGCILTLVALTVIFAFILIVGGGREGEGDRPSEATLQIRAESECKDAVKARLKAPASADFVSAAVVGGPDRYTVVGQVDAENSFGARLRNMYTCEVRYTGGDVYRGSNWPVEDVQVVAR